MNNRLFTRILAVLALSLATLTIQAQTTAGNDTASRVSFQNNNSNGVTVSGLQSVSANNRLNAQAQLSNTTGNHRHVYYRFRWLDSQGAQLGGGSSWKPILLTGNQSQTVREAAPSANAADFRLEINVE